MEDVRAAAARRRSGRHQRLHRPARRRLRAGDHAHRGGGPGYHAAQIGAFAAAGADLVTAMTMTYADEADRRSPSRRAPPGCRPSSRSPSRPTGACPAASRSPTRSPRSTSAPGTARVLHGQLRPPDALRGPSWTSRGRGTGIRGLRANASTCSHAELDEATELDEGDPADLAERYARCASGCPSSPSSAAAAAPTIATSRRSATSGCGRPASPADQGRPRDTGGTVAGRRPSRVAA